MVHVVLTVTQFSPVETVIVAPLMPVVVKATDRVVAALATRVTAAVVALSVMVMSVCVTYPVLDAV
jgi:hypothetical protein